MHDHRLYLKTLSDFTRTLLTPYDVHAMFSELSGRVTDVLGLMGSGVSLGRDGRLVFDTSHGDGVAALERVQEQFQAGPCVTAFHTRKVVTVTHLEDRRDDWPEYCEAATTLGITAVASIPMQLGNRVVGALNLYARGPRDWPDDDVAAAVVMADMATAYLINASYHRNQVELNEQLQHALESRLVIEQAKGMVAARREFTPEAAFEQIRQHARRRGVTVREVADAVVHLGLDL